MTGVVTPAQLPADKEAEAIPVSIANLKECLDSARYWIKVLPPYADSMQRRADWWAIAAGILAAISGLAVWGTIQESSSVAARITVAVVSLASAICALIPRVKNYGEMAGHARELSARYGRVSGDLLDLWSHRASLDSQAARSIVQDFDTIKAAKDANLRYLPKRPAEPKERDAHGVALWTIDDSRPGQRANQPT